MCIVLKKKLEDCDYFILLIIIVDYSINLLAIHFMHFVNIVNIKTII